MPILVPVVLPQTGTNAAVTPFDRVTGKIWTRDYNDFLGGTSNIAGTSITATVSGHTMLSDTLTCWTGGVGSSWRQTSATSQNQTATLETMLNCRVQGFPASLAGINAYVGTTCGGAPTAGGFLWDVVIDSVVPGIAGDARLSFLIRGGNQPNQLLAFVGNSNSLCFPMTISNLIPVGGVGTPITAGGFAGIRYGHGGTVTLSLADYVCEP